MKYALITEEEIQQLRFHVQHLKQIDPASLSHASLILDSLKPSDPVAWVVRRTTSEGDVVDGVWTCDPDEDGAIPVHALDDEVTK